MVQGCETKDSYYVFANHELATTRVEAPATGGAPSNAGSVPASDVIEGTRCIWHLLNRRGSNSGARVSVFQFDKDWNVVGGKNLIDTAKIVLAHTS